MAFAQRIARRYAGRGMAQEDLDQVAYVGLIKAVRRFDPDHGGPFRSFAVVTIRGELRRFFRDCGWMVRPPRQLQELQARVWDAQEQLTDSGGAPPTIAEIAAYVGVDEWRIREVRKLDGCFAPRSIDAPKGEVDRRPLADTLGQFDDGFELAEMRAVLANSAHGLSERDLAIIEQRFYRGRTQKEIGDALGITQMQVSRLLTRIMRDLRRAVGEAAAA